MKTSYGWKLLPYLRPYRLRFFWALSQVFLIAGFELLKRLTRSSRGAFRLVRRHAVHC
jgi:hypothetical protein